jgi:hypothetical protein
MSVHTLLLAIFEDFVGKRSVSRYSSTIPHSLENPLDSTRANLVYVALKVTVNFTD